MLYPHPVPKRMCQTFENAFSLTHLMSYLGFRNQPSQFLLLNVNKRLHGQVGQNKIKII